jgi:hypothetical protein
MLTIPTWDPRNAAWDYSTDHRRFAAMASDLGLRAGEWPRTVRLQNPLTGTVVTYEYNRAVVVDGDLQSVDYRQVSVAATDPTVDTRFQTSMVIFND